MAGGLLPLCGGALSIPTHCPSLLGRAHMSHPTALATCVTLQGAGQAGQRGCVCVGVCVCVCQHGIHGQQFCSPLRVGDKGQGGPSWVRLPGHRSLTGSGGTGFPRLTLGSTQTRPGHTIGAQYLQQVLECL